MPGIMLATLVLNEIEWLEKLYNQHKDWPELENWTFVEAADRVYAETNPSMVSRYGMSVDGTTEFLTKLAEKDRRVMHIRHGFSGHETDPAQGKTQARQRYMEVAEEVQPEFLIVCDGDEMYPKIFQPKILELMRMMTRADKRISSFTFKLRHPWHPPSMTDGDLFWYEAISGPFFDLCHCHFWRWSPGIRYGANHNTIEDANGVLLTRRMRRFDNIPDMPYCVHMAFASSLKSRAAKHRYYEARGEGRIDHRQKYVDTRAAFETWKEGDPLPHGARVALYDGIIPESFR